MKTEILSTMAKAGKYAQTRHPLKKRTKKDFFIFFSLSEMA
jgi:hypothetical protein